MPDIDPVVAIDRERGNLTRAVERAAAALAAFWEGDPKCTWLYLRELANELEKVGDELPLTPAAAWADKVRDDLLAAGASDYEAWCAWRGAYNAAKATEKDEAGELGTVDATP
jgi:hypothetical protein